MFGEMKLELQLKKIVVYLNLSTVKVLARILFGKSFLKIKDKKLIDPKYIKINFLESRVNLGDLLFFVPLIIELQKRCSELVIVCNKLQFNILKCFIPFNDHKNIIINKASFSEDKLFLNLVHFNGFKLSRYLSGTCYVDPVMVDGLDIPISEFICKMTINKLYTEKYITCYNPIIDKPKFLTLDFYKKNKQYTLISDEIYSGLHRLKNTQYDLFKKKILEDKSKNRIIIRLSTSKNSVFHEFADIWIKPNNSLDTLIKILSIPGIKVIAFDNFIAHFASVSRVPTIIIFRKFNKSYLNKVKKHFFPCFGGQSYFRDILKY